MTTQTNKVSSARIKNASRHEIHLSSSCNGVVDAIAPKPPTDNRHAVLSGRRSAGSQIAHALIALISEPATPRPIRPRPMIKPSSVWEKLKISEPNTAKSSMGACTLRGP
ncbi:hypothetical protein D3C71_1584900 [compost metagenome]